MKRDFKGIWIPAKIWLSDGISIQAKVLWAEIWSLYDQEKGGCYASDEYLMNFLRLGQSRFHEVLKELRDLGLVKNVSFNGRERVIKAISPDLNDEEDSGNEGSNNQNNEPSGKPEPSLPEKRKPGVRKTGTTPIDIYKKENKDMSEPTVGLTSFFLEKLKEINPKIKQPNLPKWTQEINRLLTTDKRSEEEVRKVIEFLVHDDKNPKGDFTWSQAVQSPEKLRKHFAAIWKQMNKTAAPKSEKKKQEDKFQEQEAQREVVSENSNWFNNVVIHRLFARARQNGIFFYSDSETANINSENDLSKPFMFKDPNFKDLVKKEINRRKLI